MKVRAFSHALMAPIVAFVALLGLLAATTLYAYAPGMPLKPVAALIVAGAKISIIALVFMRLRHASALTRLAAIAGLVWLVLLFGLGWIDYASRLAI